LNKERILKEAQKIAKEFSFWMVSGNIAHLYGHVYETPEKKFELEIKFDETFPTRPPHLIFHNEIKELLGEIHLKKYNQWEPEFKVVDIVSELKLRIQEALHVPETEKKGESNPLETAEEKYDPSDTDEYITPDPNAYPEEFQSEDYITPSDFNNNSFENKQPSKTSSEPDNTKFYTEPIFDDTEQLSLELTTELGLIQQEYAYDQKGSNAAEINIYITITLSKTFIISIDFTNFPEKPKISLPDDVKNILTDPDKALDSLKNWNSKKPAHIIDIIRELERKLYFIKEIESQYKNISGEYQCDKISDSLTSIKVHLLTYGFKEYLVEVDLEPYPKPPIIEVPPELQQIINVPISELKSFNNWLENESNVVEVIREISWLVDKNSRINFEIDLLKDHYKNIKYDYSTAILLVEMKGKMKTEDLTFEFQINLPSDYPMKMPDIKVVNEFELETHEKIKNDLHASFNDFFKEWTPFSYLIDLFNLVSKKIFEVSVVSCVICHKIECPSCTKKIAGDESCHTECPHCNRAYHRHCWEQTIQSFGKCGFCLR
jgi:ubiquitin-protein ligase